MNYVDYIPTRAKNAQEPEFFQAAEEVLNLARSAIKSKR